MGELFDDAVIDALVEDEVAFGCQLLGCRQLFPQLFFGRVLEHDLTVVERLQGGVGVHIDGGVEDGAPVDVGERGDVGAAAGQA